MPLKKAKYLLLLLCLAPFGQLVFSRQTGAVQTSYGEEKTANQRMVADSVQSQPSGSLLPGDATQKQQGDSLRPIMLAGDSLGNSPKSVLLPSHDSLRKDSAMQHHVQQPLADSLKKWIKPSLSLNPDLQEDSIRVLPPFGNDSLRRAQDSIRHKPFLDVPIAGKSKDSLVYDVKNRKVYVYEKGDVAYQDKNLKADYMEIDMPTKVIHAYGRKEIDKKDSTKTVMTRPQFTDAGATYQMDTVIYNLTTSKARIRNVSTKDGEGYLQGGQSKKMKDNTINIAHGKYTTCDAEHPHFYLAMTKAKTIPNKKVIIGPSYLVMEDVPIYFLGLPFGFFPIMSGRHSGFIMPTWGEEAIKGFYLRDAGYYFAFNDYLDMTVTGGIYTLGSWQASLGSRYVKRYKYRGGLTFNYSKDIIGEKGDPDYVNMNNIQLQWTHQQDPKFRPNSTFSASVNFSTSGYTKYGTKNINDYLNTQTNSSISYSKSWAGTPFAFSTNLQHSQNSKDTTIMISFPNAVFSVSKIYPFRRKDAEGKQKWYEKISFSYTGTLGNSVTTKERDFFKDKMFKMMKNGINHVIPVNTSLTLFNYLNITPSFNYQERWYFNKVNQAWDPVSRKVVNADTTYGFYRLYDYSTSLSFSTKIYGMYQFKKGAAVQAIRHMITPTISASYRPDFGDPSYGYYQYVQSDTLGRLTRYSPFSNGLYGVPSAGRSASVSFGIVQTLEMKVRSQKDTSGVRKLKLIDNLSITSSYNFMADSLKLAPFALNLRTTVVKDIGLNITATLDPYQVDATGRRINRFMWEKGSIGRLTNVSTSFGYMFKSKGNTGNKDASKPSQATPAINTANPPPPEYTDMFAQPGFNDLDAFTRRQMMASKYYDFDVPWTLGFNYTFTYSNTGIKRSIVQTLGFNGSVTLTPKWGITFNAGYDMEARKITPGTFTLTRDLHCWQMSFNWVPIGFRKSWNFSISVKAATLKDLKYDRSNSFYDNFYDN